MKKPKLTKVEEQVLMALYERRERDGSTPTDELIAATGLSRGEVVAALASLKEQKMIGGGPPSLADTASELLQEMDSGLTPTKPGYAEHVILAASLLAKADEGYLAAELGYDPEFVSTVGSRLRTGGVWTGDGVNEVHKTIWMESENGGIDFFLCGAVATGDLMIVGHGPAGPMYQMTEGGKTKVENLLKKRPAA